MGAVLFALAIAAGVPGRESVAVAALPRPRQVVVPPQFDMPIRVFALTGENPRECGRFPMREVNGTRQVATGNELEAAVRCARQAVVDGQPFWTYVVRRGIDSWIAHGLLRTASGQLHFFSYDAAPCGGPGCEPRLSLQRCEAPAVKPAADGNSPDFTCRRFGPP